MDGIHDLGGIDGFGRVEPEPNEPVFHAPWEARVLAMMHAMRNAARWTIDQERFAQERLHPQAYLAVSYYQRWFLALQRLLLEKGLIAREELDAGHTLQPGKPLACGPFTLRDVPRPMTRRPFDRPAPAPARFTAGDRVRAKNLHPATHTRLPRYVRGHVGLVDRVHGCFVFPDVAALDRGEDPQWLYTVVFAGVELWGPDADPTLTISIDAFEPYLEGAGHDNP